MICADCGYDAGRVFDADPYGRGWITPRYVHVCVACYSRRNYEPPEGHAEISGPTVQEQQAANREVKR